MQHSDDIYPHALSARIETACAGTLHRLFLRSSFERSLACLGLQRVDDLAFQFWLMDQMFGSNRLPDTSWSMISLCEYLKEQMSKAQALFGSNELARAGHQTTATLRAASCGASRRPPPNGSCLTPTAADNMYLRSQSNSVRMGYGSVEAADRAPGDFTRRDTRSNRK